ncbi:MAG: antibiotic biosynthesis monooxygenase [Crocinitomicaceae bacterium]
MFVAIYTFTIHPNKEAEFIEAWEALTKLIYEYENSLGSRLHRKSETEFIAYAQWPDKNTWKNSGDKLPVSATQWRQQMRASCSNIETQHELEMLSDLIQQQTHQ